MNNAIKIIAYGYIGLTCSTSALTAVGSLLETAAEKCLRRCLAQQPVKFTHSTGRYFSSAADEAWNTGYVPLRKHTFNLPANSHNGLDQPVFLRTMQGEINWHFDPLRSLYYYFKDEASVAVNQNTELKKPIKQDEDMVVYNLPAQKKSLNLTK